jgi:hypothetical protein
VQNAREEILQVYALAEAVGGDQDARLVARHLGDALFAQIVRILARDDAQVELGEFLPERGLEVRAEIFCRLYVAAEYERPDALLDPVFEHHRGGVELLVVVDVAELLQALGELAQLSALTFGPVSLLNDLSRRRIGTLLDDFSPDECANYFVNSG